MVTLFASARAQAEIELTTPLLSDGALLQRGAPIAISGRGAPQGARVTATLGNESLGHEMQQAIASGDGTWRVVFDARPAGGPLALTVRVGREQKIVRDLLLGDLWVCSGQSNMEFVLRDALGAEAEIRAAHDPAIRHFKIPRSWAASPEATLAGGSWARATPDGVGDFSAVGYYFAKKLRADTGQAITLDVGEAHDIHPRDKQTVGTRLALIALAQDYGQQDVHHRGPAFGSSQVDGSRLVVRFDTREGLATHPKNPRVLGFEIGRPGSRFAAVQGIIEGNTVVIPFQGPAPTAVRYAWDDHPEHANLKDPKGLPAEPFRALVGNP